MINITIHDNRTPGIIGIILNSFLQQPVAITLAIVVPVIFLSELSKGIQFLGKLITPTKYLLKINDYDLYNKKLYEYCDLELEIHECNIDNITNLSKLISRLKDNIFATRSIKNKSLELLKLLRIKDNNQIPNKFEELRGEFFKII